MTRPGKKAMASYWKTPGTAWQFTRTRHFGSITGTAVLNSYCQKLPPSTAACPSATAPTPTHPSCASPPPETTSVSVLKPVRAAQSALTLPIISALSVTAG